MLNPMRHRSVFDPEKFSSRVDVIGCGATGSRIVLGLARLGIEDIHVWDFDTVANHNLANQVYNISDIGRPKVAALSDIVKEATGTSLRVHNECVDGTQVLGDIVFLLTDSMVSRREIWEKGIKYKLRTSLMIETRMGSDSGRVYTVDPKVLAHILGWEETLCDDANAVEVTACGTSITVGPTAEVISGFAVWQLIRWVARLGGGEDEVDNEILVFTRPPMIVTRKF
jgi:molybdopterin/thiamine biosynthesis adenylyltransferase